VNVLPEYTKEDLTSALKVVSSTISKCEKIQSKFAAGTSQHTLLKNRLRAMYISRALLTGDSAASQYTKEELLAAIPPVSSIIRKCEKAQEKFSAGTSYHRRFQEIIVAMYLSKALITMEIGKRE
jgi:hypothetical protein